MTDLHVLARGEGLRFRLPGKSGEECGTGCILPGEGGRSEKGVHHPLVVGVEDGNIQPAAQRHGEKGLVEGFPCRKAKGDVGDAQDGFQPQLPFDQGGRFQGFGGIVLPGADGEGQAVDEQPLFRDAVGQGAVPDFFGHGKAFPGRGWNPVFIQSEADDHGAVFAGQRENLRH